MKYSEVTSAGNFPYPSHAQDPKVKQTVPEKFLLPYAKAAYADWGDYGKGVFAANAGEYELNRLYALGKQPIDQYKQKLNVDPVTNETWLAIDWSVRPIVSTYRDKAISRLMEQEYKVVATPIDALAKTAVSDYVAGMKAKLAVRKLIEQTNNNGLAQHPLITLQPDDPLDNEELEMRVEMGEQFNRSKDAELAIEMGFYENGAHILRKERYEMLFDCGVTGYEEWLGEDGKAKHENIDPECVVVSRCKKADFSDAVHVGRQLDVSLVDLATVADKDGNPVFGEKDLQEFAASVCGKWGNPLRLGSGTGLQGVEKFKAKVLSLYLFSYDDYVWRTAPNGEGNEDLRRAEYGRRSEKYTRKTLKCVYRVKWVVGTDKCYDFGLCYDQKRPVDVAKKAKAELPIRLVAYNFYNMKAQSFMERLRPYLDEYQMNNYKIQNFRNRSVPSGYWIDMDALEAAALKKGGKDMTPLQLIQMFFDTGIMVGRSHKADGSPLFTNSAPILPMSNTAASELAMLYQDQISIVQAIERLTGFNDTTMGDTPQKMLVPGIEAAQLSTSHALFPLFFAEKCLTEKLAEDTLLRMQQGLRKFGKLTGYAPALNANTLKFVELNGELSMRQYGIKLEVKTTDEMKMWVLQQMQGDIANGFLDTSDAIMILNTHNVKQAMLILQHRVKKAKELMQQQKMQELQSVNEAQAQRDQAAQQARAQELQLQAQVEVEKAKISAQAEIEKEKLRQQTEITKEQMRYSALMQKTDADNQAKITVAHKQNEGKIAATQIAAEASKEETLLAGELAKEKQEIANKKPQPKSTSKK